MVISLIYVLQQVRMSSLFTTVLDLTYDTIRYEMLF